MLPDAERKATLACCLTTILLTKTSFTADPWEEQCVTAQQHYNPDVLSLTMTLLKHP